MVAPVPAPSSVAESAPSSLVRAAAVMASLLAADGAHGLTGRSSPAIDREPLMPWSVAAEPRCAALYSLTWLE